MDQLQQSAEFNIVTRTFNDDETKEDELFSKIHMNAIINGNFYLREEAAASLVRYADTIFGNKYEGKRSKPNKKSYELTSEIKNIVQELAEEYDVDYMLFCNFHKIDVKRVTDLFEVQTTPELRGKEIQVMMEYYLIDTKSGKVFEGINSKNKVSIITDDVFGKYGQAFTIQDLLQYVFDVQSQQLTKNIIKTGIKVLCGD